MSTLFRDATILVAGAALGGFCYWLATCSKRRKCLSFSYYHNNLDAALHMSPLVPAPSSARPSPLKSNAMDLEKDDIVAEQLTRNIQFFHIDF